MASARKGPGIGAKKKGSDETPKTTEDSREEPAASNGDKGSRGEDSTPPKPPSAGVTTRDSAQKLLNLATKGEWTGVESVVKQLEKSIANLGEEADSTPLAGILDPVSNNCVNELTFIQCCQNNFFFTSFAIQKH